MRDLHIEVTLGLEEATQILVTFVEEILIHRTFFVNGHQFLNFALGNFGALDANRYDRALFHQKVEIQLIFYRHILLGREGHGCSQVFRLGVILAQPGKRAIDRVPVDLGVSFQLRSFAKLFLGKAALPFHIDGAHSRDLVGIDGVVQIDQRIRRIDRGGT